MTYLICGSPGCGKSTFIRERVKRGDLVCELDLLYSAITGNLPHDTEVFTYDVACKLMTRLADIIRDRDGSWGDAYVTSIANTPEKVKAEIERVGADKCILIDTPMDVCLKRIKDRPFYFQFLIEEWFATETISKSYQEMGIERYDNSEEKEIKQ